MLSFRSASFGDEHLVYDYIVKLAIYEKMESEVVKDVSLITSNIFTDKKANCILISDEDGNYVGFSLYFFNFSTFNLKPGIYIEDLYIDEEYRGMGYGTQVFDFYKELAKKENCGRIEWICLDWNKSAIEFYENKIGAKSIDGWTIRRLIEEQF